MCLCRCLFTCCCLLLFVIFMFNACCSLLVSRYSLVEVRWFFVVCWLL